MKQIFNFLNYVSDPFARIAFLGQSQVTEKLDKTLCPTWDQTLIFEQIEIHGDPKQIAQKPPEIVLEIFDHDTFVSSITKFSMIYLRDRPDWRDLQ